LWTGIIAPCEMVVKGFSRKFEKNRKIFIFFLFLPISSYIMEFD